MSFDISQVVSALGDEAIAQAGEPLGLSKDQSVRAAHAFAAHAGLGNEAMIQAVAADTGLDQEVVAAMLKRLMEIGAEKIMQETPIGAAIDTVKQDAMAAFGSVGDAAAKNAGGLLGRMFGRK